MKKFLFFGFILILIVLVMSFFILEDVLFVSKADILGLSKLGDYAFLLLGKPGPGYIGSQNTDSLMVVYYNNSNNKIFLIAVPRDLIIRNEKGKFEKINALYEEKKIELLLNKVSAFTGIKVRDYFAVDMILVRKLVDKLGGVEVVLEQPVIEAASFYTLPAGKYKLDGSLVEFILRSRYNSEGDFFRIKNQMKFLQSLKDKLSNLNNNEIIELLKFLEANKHYWDSSFDKNTLLLYFLKTKNFRDLKIVPIIVDLKSDLLKSGYFELYNTSNVSGVYPALGVDNFDSINYYIWSKIKENLK